MRVKMASLYGKKDIRIRETELPDLRDDEILIKVMSNGICFSTYKAAMKGEEHLRVPENVHETPVVREVRTHQVIPLNFSGEMRLTRSFREAILNPDVF